MSMPQDQQQQQPSVTAPQKSYGTHSGHGSIGPVIAVLAVTIILGILAGMIGRLCSGRRILGHGQYDMESWAESKCSSCIDGRIYVEPPSSRNVFGGSVPVSNPIQITQETKQEEQSPPQNPPANVDS